MVPLEAHRETPTFKPPDRLSRVGQNYHIAHAREKGAGRAGRAKEILGDQVAGAMDFGAPGQRALQEINAFVEQFLFDMQKEVAGRACRYERRARAICAQVSFNAGNFAVEIAGRVWRNLDLAMVSGQDQQRIAGQLAQFLVEALFQR